MKLHSTDAPAAVISGATEATQFKFKMTAQAAQMLSSNLYKDARRAIVRELSCNAWDAHIDAGNTNTPIDICLPGRLSPVLIIRDYGTGLSHEDAMTLYTTYFDSTKNDSNEATGALGLGSKSPLGYTNNYAVSSIQDGKKRTYAIFIDAESGMPSCVYGGEVDTDEANGLEIKVPTKDNDFWEWQRAAQRVLQFFPKGSFNLDDEDVDIPEINETETFCDVTLTEGGFDGFNSDWLVQMGNVAYPIEFDQLNDRFGILHQYAYGLVKVNMGDVMFTPDRDNLFYNNQTIAVLEEKFDAFLTAYTKSFHDELAAVKNLAEWRTLVKRLDGNKLAQAEKSLQQDVTILGYKLKANALGMDKIQSLLNAKEKGMTFQGEKLTGWGALFKRAHIHGIDTDGTLFGSVFGKEDHHRKFIFSGAWNRFFSNKFTCKSWVYEYKRGRSWGGTVRPAEREDAYDKVILLVNDLTWGAVTLTRDWIKNDSPFGTESGWNTNKSRCGVLYFNNESDAAPAEKWFEDNDLPFEIINLSQTDVPNMRKVNVKGTAKGKTCMMLTENRDYWRQGVNAKRAMWDRGRDLEYVMDNFHDKYVWVETKMYDPQNAKSVSSQCDLIDLAARQRYGINGIVGVKKAEADLFINDPRWTHIDDARQVYAENQVAKLTEETVKGHKLRVALSETGSKTLTWLLSNLDSIESDDIVDLVLEMPKLHHITDYDKTKELAQACNLTIPAQDFDAQPLADALEMMYTKVPCWKVVVGRELADEEVLKLFNTFTNED
jgi:hypothetical protein